MKRLCLCLVLALSFAQFSYLGAQEALVELDPIASLPVQIASTPGDVLALGVNIANSSNTPYHLIHYASSQTWYMNIIVINGAGVSKSFKAEFDLRYADGASYYVYRKAYTIGAATTAVIRVNVTAYVAKLGIFTLTGRVYGKAMGNDNKVTSQVFAY